MVISMMLSTVIVGSLISNIETLRLPSWCFLHCYKLSSRAFIVSPSLETLSWSFVAITILKIVGMEASIHEHKQDPRLPVSYWK